MYIASSKAAEDDYFVRIVLADYAVDYSLDDFVRSLTSLRTACA